MDGVAGISEQRKEAIAAIIASNSGKWVLSNHKAWAWRKGDCYTFKFILFGFLFSDPICVLVLNAFKNLRKILRTFFFEPSLSESASFLVLRLDLERDAQDAIVESISSITNKVSFFDIQL